MQQASTSANGIHHGGVIVAALYKFVPLTLAQCKEMQMTLKALMFRYSMTGYLRVATEGFNGSVVGTRNALDIFNAELQDLQSRFGVAHKGSDLVYKESWHYEYPIKTASVRLTKEIVTFCQEVDLTETGKYVEPSNWNVAMKEADVVIDVRNDCEIQLGTFAGAVNPETQTFAEFATFVDEKLTPDQSVAMFCTGGVRCEKASAFLKQKGFGTVSQLHGGVLQYFRDVPANRSEWEGECFLFDYRGSVGHEQELSSYLMINANTNSSKP